MRLLDLTLENYGLFCGVHSFDLTTTTDRPIVLVGGKNGAGKTTFLEAIRLCLYGPLSLDRRVGREEYLRHLAGRIHRVKDGAPVFRARVALSFTHAADASESHYRVTRSWTKSGDGAAIEALDIQRDGYPLDDREQHHWNDFVEELVPFGVSQLFFFDGEKIKSLADDESAMAELAGSMKSMLGIDLVERLEADLGIYRSRRVKDAAKRGDRQKLDEANEARSELLKRQEELELALQSLEAERARQESILATAEAELRRGGGAFAKRRDEVKADLSALEGKLETLESRGRQMVEGALPFAFCPGLASRLCDQIASEQHEQERAAARGGLDELAELVRQEIDGETSLVAKRNRAGLAARLTEIIMGSVAEAPQGFRFIHGFSQADGQSCRHLLTDLVATARADAGALARELEETTASLRAARRAVDQAPDDDQLGRHLEEVVSQRSRLETVSRQLEQTTAELAKTQNLLAARQREVERFTDRIASEEAVARRLGVVDRSIDAMRAYRGRLTQVKLEQLEQRIRVRFHALARKEELVHRVEVDPDRFEVLVLDQSGNRIDRRELSAGEKQILAIATLWGLADVSGRPLPTVVDTPLGRLDSDHRAKLIGEYFPKVSHQAIILSTDTEVDERLYSALESHVNRAYRLRSEARLGRTTVEEGYFWRGEGS